MVRVRRPRRFFLLVLLALAALIVPLLLGLIVRHAAVQASGCWKAEITEQWTNLELAGSVLRVSVEGRGGLPVILRSLGGFETISVTGTKPEYGPSVAEFAPLSRGTYFIEPQGLGIVFEVWLDGQGYTRVDFTPTACAEPAAPEAQPATATSAPPPAATSQPAPTATPVPPAAPPPAAQPQPAASWQGRIAQHLPNPDGSVHWATIAVRVIGRPAGQPVEIYADPWSAVEKTGTKPEHGPDACEFGALNAGTYRLVATDLGASLDVAVERGDFVLVEFYQSGGAAVSSYWVGSVVENTSGSEPTEHANSAIAIIVSGKLWYDVEIQTDGWSSTAQTGYKPEYGPDACEFGGLRAATYTIIPKDLGVSAQVTVDGWGWAMVRFDEVVAHAPQPTAPPASEASQPEAEPTATATTPPDQPSPEASAPAAEPRWQGWVASNTSGEQEGTGIWSVVVVRVLNWAGVPVTITGGGGWSATCTTGTKPEYGPDACEFGGLWPGTYYLQPEGADIRVEVEMDGLGTAFVEFAAP